jgi:hypothetical protein
MLAPPGVDSRKPAPEPEAATVPMGMLVPKTSAKRARLSCMLRDFVAVLQRAPTVRRTARQ